MEITPSSRRRVVGHGLGHVVVGEEARARDEAVRARGRARADRLGRGLDAAVDLCGNQPSSKRRVDGVEVDATIQHEHAVKF